MKRTRDGLPAVAAAVAIAACASARAPVPDAAAEDAGAGAGEVASVAVEPSRVCVGAGSTAAIRVRIARAPGSPTSDVAIAAESPDGIDVAAPPIGALDTEVTATISPPAALAAGSYTVVVRAGVAAADLQVDVGPGPGALDTSLGGGLASAPGVASPTTTAVVIDEYAILVAQGGAPTSTLVRFVETGEADASFGSTGRAELPYEARALVRRRNGRIVAASRNGVVQLDAAGRALGPFGDGTPLSVPTCIVEELGESVLVAGYVPDCCGFVARIPVSGVTSMTRDVNSLYGCALAPDGRLLVGGYTGLWRLSPELLIDETLSSDTTSAVIASSDGRFATATDDRVLAWTDDGSLDPAFHALYTTAVALAYERDGSILALGSSGSILRLRPGRMEEPLIDAPVEVASPSFAVDACGRIVVAGNAPDGSIAVQRFWP